MKTKQLPPTPVRLPPDLKDWLKARAEENVRSLNGEIVAILLQAKARHEQAAA